MYNEARRRPDEASAWYCKILEDGSADQETLRRQIAAVKGEDGPAAAIAKLAKHLEVFQNDLIAWEELAELYVQVGYSLRPDPIIHLATNVLSRSPCSPQSDSTAAICVIADHDLL